MSVEEKYQAARDAAAKIKAQVEVGGGTWTDEERTAFDEHMAAAQSALADVKREKSLLLLDTEADRPEKRVAQPDPPGRGTIEQRIDVVGYRGKLTAFRGPDAVQKAYRTGRFLAASLFGHERSRAWCQEHGIEFRIMSGTVNTAGGFLVPVEMENAIIDILEDYGVMRKLMRTRPMTSDTKMIARKTSNIIAYAMPEGNAAQASDMAFDQVQLIAKDWGTLTRYSSQLSEDAVIDMADEITTDAAKAHAKKQDQCAIDGSGAATYQGIAGIEFLFNANTGWAGYVSALATHDTFAEVDAEDLGKVMGAVRPVDAKTGAAWLCSPEFKSIVFDTLQSAAGGNTQREIAGKMIDSYRGYPIFESTLLPATATTAKVMCFFGNFNLAGTIGDRKGMTVKADASRYLEYNQIAILTVMRYDINWHDLGDATLAGPVCGLIALT